MNVRDWIFPCFHTIQKGGPVRLTTICLHGKILINLRNCILRKRIIRKRFDRSTDKLATIHKDLSFISLNGHTVIRVVSNNEFHILRICCRKQKSRCCVIAVSIYWHTILKRHRVRGLPPYACWTTMLSCLPSLFESPDSNINMMCTPVGQFAT